MLVPPRAFRGPEPCCWLFVTAATDPSVGEAQWAPGTGWAPGARAPPLRAAGLPSQYQPCVMTGHQASSCCLCGLCIRVSLPALVTARELQGFSMRLLQGWCSDVLLLRVATRHPLKDLALALHTAAWAVRFSRGPSLPGTAGTLGPVLGHQGLGTTRPLLGCARGFGGRAAHSWALRAAESRCPQGHLLPSREPL